jgi:hypothetical protein
MVASAGSPVVAYAPYEVDDSSFFESDFAGPVARELAEAGAALAAHALDAQCQRSESRSPARLVERFRMLSLRLLLMSPDRSTAERAELLRGGRAYLGARDRSRTVLVALLERERSRFGAPAQYRARHYADLLRLADQIAKVIQRWERGEPDPVFEV